MSRRAPRRACPHSVPLTKTCLASPHLPPLRTPVHCDRSHTHSPLTCTVLVCQGRTWRWWTGKGAGRASKEEVRPTQAARTPTFTSYLEPSLYFLPRVPVGVDGGDGGIAAGTRGAARRPLDPRSEKAEDGGSGLYSTKTSLQPYGRPGVSAPSTFSAQSTRLDLSNIKEAASRIANAS